MCRSLPDSSGPGCLLHCAICQLLCLCKSWCRLLLSLNASEVVLPLCQIRLAAISLLSFAKLSWKEEKKTEEGGSRVKWEVVNSKENITVCYYVQMQTKAAVETGVKLMPRGYAKGQQSSMLVDAVLGFPERHVSDSTSALHFWGQLFGLGLGFQAEYEAGFAGKQVKTGTAMYLAQKGTWAFLGLGDVRKREKQQCTEYLRLGKCLVRRRQSPLCLLICCQCTVTDFGKLKKEISSKAVPVLFTRNLHFLLADLLDLFSYSAKRGFISPITFYEFLKSQQESQQQPGDHNGPATHQCKSSELHGCVPHNAHNPKKPLPVPTSAAPAEYPPL